MSALLVPNLNVPSKPKQPENGQHPRLVGVSEHEGVAREPCLDRKEPFGGLPGRPRVGSRVRLVFLDSDKKELSFRIGRGTSSWSASFPRLIVNVDHSSRIKPDDGEGSVHDRICTCEVIEECCQSIGVRIVDTEPNPNAPPVRQRARRPEAARTTREAMFA